MRDVTELILDLGLLLKYYMAKQLSSRISDRSKILVIVFNQSPTLQA